MASISASIPSPSPTVPPVAAPPRLLDVVRELASRHGHPERTIASFVSWVTRFVRFHRLRHPRELELSDVSRFLEQVARETREPLPAI